MEFIPSGSPREWDLHPPDHRDTDIEHFNYLGTESAQTILRRLILIILDAWLRIFANVASGCPLLQCSRRKAAIPHRRTQWKHAPHTPHPHTPASTTRAHPSRTRTCTHPLFLHRSTALICIRHCRGGPSSTVRSTTVRTTPFHSPTIHLEFIQRRANPVLSSSPHGTAIYSTPHPSIRHLCNNPSSSDATALASPPA